MRSKIYLFVAAIISITFYAQESQESPPFFPDDQHCYFGGFPEFYKDFNKIILENKLKPCEDKKELYTAFVLIGEDYSAQVLENQSSKINKCAFELTKIVVSHMDKWIPARIGGQAAKSIARILIFPDALFENYYQGYDIGQKFTIPSYGNGVGFVEFRKEVSKRIDMDRFYVKGAGKLKVAASFEIDENGQLNNLEMTKSSGLAEFDEMILYAIKSSAKKKNFSPAKIHGIPIKMQFNLPFGVTEND
ncbi:energy transducer TonB [Chryseobacterium koreense]|uniref:energy transducer TonB n=1 Tax=Chryseobacterium koreense TaxID=232216 RepID=UPI0026EE23CB|nr:energy transducer TonB [Chryseobacterium koreense]